MRNRCSQMIAVFLTAVAVNYPWELAQSLLYVGGDDLRVAFSHCFLASVGDGFLVLLILSTGRFVRGSWDWFAHPGAGGYVLMLTVGLFIGLAVEWIAVHIVHRWRYTPDMPRLLGFDVGVVPVAQMLLLPPLIFWAARIVLERRAPPAS